MVLHTSGIPGRYTQRKEVWDDIVKATVNLRNTLVLRKTVKLNFTDHVDLSDSWVELIFYWKGHAS